jgi:TusA-related sulfurtransferase
MSNSSLVSYTRISPNKTSPRKNKIDTITIHCVVGQLSVETIGNVFASASRQASSNYGIGPDGRIGMYVEEKDRSWCSSNAANDHRAITIEVASDTTHPYKVTAAAYEALIKLCADICKRNDIKELKWKGDKSLIGQIDKQNMTVHRWFANKSCPGDYLYNLHGDIANRVNKLLNPIPEKPSTEKVLYRVQTGAFSNKTYADNLEAKLKKAGFDTYMVKVGNLYKVQVGAFGVKANADTMAKKLKAAGFDTYITTESGTPVQSNIKAPTLKVGSKVKVTGTNYATGQSIPSFVRNNTYTIQQISGDKVLLKEIISWVYKKDVKLV